MELKVGFYHGFGDCVHSAFMLPLYINRGYSVTVHCHQDRNILFKAAGANINNTEHPQIPKIAWEHGRQLNNATITNYWECNKSYHNISLPPMPNIGSNKDLWIEYCNTQLDIKPQIPQETWNTVDNFLKNIHKPIILFHPIGNSFTETKSLPKTTIEEYYKQLIEQTDHHLIILDWDNRVPRHNNSRIWHLEDEWGKITIPELLALEYRSNLLIGIDSGPLHSTRFTQIPTIGLWRRDHYPAQYSTPRNNQINLTDHTHTHNYNKQMRIPYNIIETQTDDITAQSIIKTQKQILNKPKYLNNKHIGRDLLLQQMIEWTNNDRHNGFNIICDLTSNRFTNPQMVETGCIRAEEDFKGAGFSTYIFGAYLELINGKLVSVDDNLRNCEFARKWIAIYNNTVSVVCNNTIRYLKDRREKIDILYLDNIDTNIQGYQENCLEEVQAAYHLLHNDSIIMMDDTISRFKTSWGRGIKAIEWLKNRGWKIIYSGYQVIMAMY